MRRRDFLRGSARALVAASMLPRVTGRTMQWEAAAQADADQWDPLLADLEQQIPMLMREARVPGLSIVIVRNGAVLWRRPFGVRDIETKVPVDNDTLFEAASTSKPLFAYAVMKLCERGVLSPDTPLTHYTATRIIEGDPRLDLITARHVLSHTSGLPNWRSSDDPLSIHFTPGTQWSYSGEGYSYLQRVVTELVGGREDRRNCAPFEAGLQVCAMVPDIATYMNANVLGPFGMSSSGYLWTPAMEVHMARGHDPQGKPSNAKRKPSGPSLARYGMAGGLCTTPTDYAKFLLQVIDPKPEGQFRISASSCEEMLRSQIRRNPESSWALGWEINHTPDGDYIRHGGGNPGFSCFVAGSVANKSGYVIMTNCEDNGYFGVIAKLISGDTLSKFIGGKLRAASE